MKDVERTCLKYENGLRQGDHGRSKKCSIEDQVAHYRDTIQHLRDVETMTRQILDEAGVSTIWYAYYYAFTRSLDKLQRKGISGEALAIEAALKIGLWVGRGLRQSVLEAIRTQVFNVGPPTP